MIRNIRYKRDQRQLEEEEEIWFNEEEDFTEVPPSKPEIESYSMMKSKLDRSDVTCRAETNQIVLLSRQNRYREE